MRSSFNVGFQCSFRHRYESKTKNIVVREQLNRISCSAYERIVVSALDISLRHVLMLHLWKTCAYDCTVRSGLSSTGLSLSTGGRGRGKGRERGCRSWTNEPLDDRKGLCQSIKTIMQECMWSSTPSHPLVEDCWLNMQFLLKNTLYPQYHIFYTMYCSTNICW